MVTAQAIAKNFFRLPTSVWADMLKNAFSIRFDLCSLLRMNKILFSRIKILYATCSVWDFCKTKCRDWAVTSVNNETFARLQDGHESNVVFRTEIKGDYLIVPGEEHHYLLPNKDKRIIHYRYNTIKAIYECNDYSEKYQDFWLDTLALVSEESIGCWKLVRKGILEFT